MRNLAKDIPARIANAHSTKKLAEAIRRVIPTGKASAETKDAAPETHEITAPYGSRAKEIPIFFVVGYRRSGTTWLMRTLNQHPEILCRGEGKFFGQDVRNKSRIEQLVGEDVDDLSAAVAPPTSLYNALAENEEFKLWTHLSFWTRKGDAEEYLKRFVRQIITSVMVEKLAGTGKRMVGDKTPLQSTMILREIAEIFPDSRVIHIIRDGRDSAVSSQHKRWSRGRPVNEGESRTESQNKRERYWNDPESFLANGESIFSGTALQTAAEEWSTRVGAARRDGPHLLRERYTEVRYEDLLDWPEKEMRRLFDFLNASTDDELVRQCVRATSFEKLSGRSRGQQDVRSPIRKGVAGDWQNFFTERDREVYKAAVGSLLVDLGYEQNKDW